MKAQYFHDFYGQVGQDIKSIYIHFQVSWLQMYTLGKVLV